MKEEEEKIKYGRIGMAFKMKGLVNQHQQPHMITKNLYL